MNKKIKLSLLGTLIAGSALAVTLPIDSCSASTDAVLTATECAGAATTAYATYIINFFILLSDNKILEYQNKNKINENNIAIGFSQEPDEGVYSPDSTS